MYNFNSFLNEGESKKPKSVYFTKRIPITQMDVNLICDEMGLTGDVKFLSSGSFGNAYKIGKDKVLKITTDKREAKTVYELLDEEQNDSLIKYYDISRYKLKNQFVYVIVMDYAMPLITYVKKLSTDYETFLDEIITIFFTCWGKLDSIEDYKNEIIEQTDWDIPEKGFQRLAIEKLWKMYKDLEYLDECPDFHIYNLGIKDNMDFVMFDFCDLGVVNKFDEPRIIGQIAPKSKLESKSHGHIKSINEFFGLFKDDEEDKIALEFIKRLEKVKDVNPYDIKKIGKIDLPESAKDIKSYDHFYQAIFDDVVVIVASDVNLRSGSSIYALYVDDERIQCRKRYAGKIFNLLSQIFQSNAKRVRVEKVKKSINPAADLLERASKRIEDLEEYRGLPSEQEEDLREIFFEFIDAKEFTKEEAWEYFQPRSQSFADFLTKLEEETDWFDYTQMDEIFQEISLYIEEMDEDDVEWDENEH